MLADHHGNCATVFRPKSANDGAEKEPRHTEERGYATSGPAFSQHTSASSAVRAACCVEGILLCLHSASN